MLTDIARTYQQFVDRNVELKRREDELQLSINRLEAKEDELQRTISGLKQQQLSELREFNVDNNTVDLETKQEKVIFTNDIFIPSPTMIIDYPPNENETPYYPSQVESSSQTLYVPHIEEGISSVEGGNSKIFDTGDLFHLNLSLDNRTVSLIQEND